MTIDSPLPTIPAQVIDAIDARERRSDVGGAAQVADLELSARIEVSGGLTGRMGERIEVVEDPHLLAPREQRVDEVGADETGAAGDQGEAHQIVSSSRLAASA